MNPRPDIDFVPTVRAGAPKPLQRCWSRVETIP